MKKFSAASILLFLLLIPMLFHADYVTTGARNGLLLWYNSVVPALFPFMVLSGLIVSGGGIDQIMEPFYRILHPLFGLSRDGCYVMVSGLLCGYPMGAKTCADFVRNGQISLQEGRFLMAVSNHPSPMFLLGYMFPYFSDYITVSELLACVYLPVVILAVIAKFVYLIPRHRELLQKTEPASTPCSHRPPSADETILSSIEVLCKIGGYLVLFSIFIVFIQSVSFLSDQIKRLLIGTMEMTTGIREFSMLSSESPVIAFTSSVAALTFGGLSGLFQTKAVISDYEKKAGLSIRPYFFWKLSHAALSAGIAYFICIHP